MSELLLVGWMAAFLLGLLFWKNQIGGRLITIGLCLCNPKTSLLLRAYVDILRRIVDLYEEETFVSCDITITPHPDGLAVEAEIKRTETP